MSGFGAEGGRPVWETGRDRAPRAGGRPPAATPGAASGTGSGQGSSARIGLAPCLLGVGLALPEHGFDRAQSEALLNQMCPPPAGRRRAWRALLRRSGVEHRHSAVLGNEALTLPLADTKQRMELFAIHAPPLGEAAARSALARAGAGADCVTHLISVSCTGLSAPGLGVALCRRLELAARVERSDVSFMGCHGVLVALRQAAAVVRAEHSARVLVVAVELCTLHVQRAWSDEQAVAQALFGDGAGAVLLGMPARASTHAGAMGMASVGMASANGTASDRGLVGPGSTGMASADPGVRPWRLLASGTLLLEQGQELLGWDVGARGFEVTLSPRLPELLAEHLRPWLESWLAELGLGLEQVGSWAAHPGGPRVLTGIERCLQLAPGALSASRAVLAEHGNMSSPSVLFVLERLGAASRPCVLLGLGPGPSLEVALLG